MDSDLTPRYRWLRIGESALMLGFPLVGVLFAINEISGTNIGSAIWFAIAIFLLSISIYTFNAYCGRNWDSDNPRLAVNKGDSERFYLLIPIFSLIMSILALWLLDITLAVLALVNFILWALYSYPRIGFKNKPIAGTIVHFLSQILLFQMGYLVLSAVSARSILASIFFALLFSGGHLQHEVIDYKVDKEAGIRTNAVVFGPRTAEKIEFSIFLFAAIYWSLLYYVEVIYRYEYLPFVLASCLQLTTMLIFGVKIAEEQRFSLLNRALYRFYFLVAGIFFMILILVRYV